MLILWFISLILINPAEVGNVVSPSSGSEVTRELYDHLFPDDSRPEYQAFENCFSGYRKLLEQGAFTNADIVTLIDYSKPSNLPRLWVIDLQNEQVIHNSLVAHGRNSGEIQAEKFSNIPQSLMSSQGFFITGEAYMGKHGYSLRLDGVESGINHRARQRAIVIHSADYVSQDFIKKYGRLGRSWGCPALPPSLSRTIIDLIKGKTCLYIYAKDAGYPEKSDII